MLWACRSELSTFDNSFYIELMVDLYPASSGSLPGPTLWTAASKTLKRIRIFFLIWEGRTRGVLRLRGGIRQPLSGTPRTKAKVQARTHNVEESLAGVNQGSARNLGEPATYSHFCRIESPRNTAPGRGDFPRAAKAEPAPRLFRADSILILAALSPSALLSERSGFTYMNEFGTPSPHSISSLPWGLLIDERNSTHIPSTMRQRGCVCRLCARSR